MYHNEGLNVIAEKYPDIDFSKIDGKVVVPVGDICEKLDLKVVFEPLRNGTAGYFDDKTKTIVINDKYPATRNLFTIAHEIGHYILHTGLNYRFDQSHKYTPEERVREREANDFAGKLLMPEQQFIKIFKKYNGNFSKLSDVFGVSSRACEVRAFNLGLIDNI